MLKIDIPTFLPFLWKKTLVFGSIPHGFPMIWWLDYVGSPLCYDLLLHCPEFRGSRRIGLLRWWRQFRDDSNLGTQISLSLLLYYHLLSWGFLSSWLFLFWWFLHVISTEQNQLLVILWTYWHSDFKISMTYWLQIADGKCLMKHGSWALVWQFAISNQATDEPTILSKSWTSDDEFQRRVCWLVCRHIYS